MNRDAFHPPQPLIAGRPYFIVSVIPLAVGLVGLAPPLTAWLVGAAIAGLGALRSVWAMRERAALRRLADEQLVLGALPNSTPLLAWRASELVSRRNRPVRAALERSLNALEPRSEHEPAPRTRFAVVRNVRPVEAPARSRVVRDRGRR